MDQDLNLKFILLGLVFLTLLNVVSAGCRTVNALTSMPCSQIGQVDNCGIDPNTGLSRYCANCGGGKFCYPPAKASEVDCGCVGANSRKYCDEAWECEECTKILGVSTSKYHLQPNEGFTCSVNVEKQDPNIHCGIAKNGKWVTGCSWSHWEGNTAVFDCNAPSSLGNYDLIGYNFKCETPDKITHITVHMPKLPDLIPTNIYFNPSVGKVSTPADVTVYIKNEGDDCTWEPVTVEVTVRAPCGNVIALKTGTITPYIQAGATRSITFYDLFTPTQPGTYTVEAYVHPDPQEIDTSDNRRAEVYKVQVKEIHDLAIIDYNIPSSAVERDTVTFSATVKNEGNQYETSTLRFYIDSSELTSCRQSISLSPSSSVTKNCLWTAVEGTHTIKIKVDVVLGETDIADNEVSGTIYVQPVDNPPTARIEATPHVVCVSDTITIHVSASDDHGLSYIYAYFDGYWHSYYCSGARTCSHTWTTSESSPGRYTYKAKARDTIGQWSTIVTDTVVVESCIFTCDLHLVEKYIEDNSLNVGEEIEVFIKAKMTYENGENPYADITVIVENGADLSETKRFYFHYSGDTDSKWFKFDTDSWQPGTYNVYVKGIGKLSCDQIPKTFIDSVILTKPIEYGNLKVYVTDCSTDQSISGAHVSISGPESREGYTDTSGYIYFDHIKVGYYHITASKLGYQSEFDEKEVYPSQTTQSYICLIKDSQPPIADPNGPYSGQVGQAIQFDGSGSYDPNGYIVSYQWDFGDGSTGSGHNPTHTYSSAGTYTVTLTVTDDEGQIGTGQTTASIYEGCDISLESFEYEPSLVKEKDIVTFTITIKNLGIRTGIDLRLEVEGDQKDFERFTLDCQESKIVELKWKVERGEKEIIVIAEADCDDVEEIEMELNVAADCLPINVLVRDHEGSTVEDAEVTVVGGEYKGSRDTNEEGVAGFCVPEGDYIIHVEYDGLVKSVSEKIDESTLIEVNLPKKIVSKACGVEIEVTAPTFAFTGEERSITVEVENPGVAVDNYLITVEGPQAHWVNPSVREITVNPKESEQVHFTYNIPMNAKEGYYYLTFTAESGLCGKKDSESVRTRVVRREERVAFAPVPEVGFEIITTEVNLTGGEETSWQIHLKNKKETIQKVKISLLGLPTGWIDYPSEVYLDPGEEKDVYFKLTPPIDVNPGTYQGEVKITYDDYSLSKAVTFFVKPVPRIKDPKFLYLIVPLAVIVLLAYWFYKKLVPKPLERVRPVIKKPLKEKEKIKEE